jgi:hypothetical protein
VNNPAEYIDKLLAVVESRAGRLLSAISAPDKGWLTPATATRLHMRLAALKVLVEAAQLSVEAHVPRQATADLNALFKSRRQD